MATRILIVDDEPNLIRMLGYALHKEGYEIVVAQTGMEALSKAAAVRPDLMILDVMMPDMNGFEVCQRIREDPELGATPIIMLSARTQTDDKITGLQAGADDYLTKPISVEEMVARVQALLARTQRLQQTQVAPAQAQEARTLGVIGAKGGVGATTVALNIAAALAKQGLDVIAAEMRGYFGTFSVQLNANPAETMAGLMALELDQIDRDAITRQLIGSKTGIRLLYAPQDVQQMRSLSAEHAEAILGILKTMTEYVVLDIPSYPTSATETIIRACDYVLMVVEPETAALTAAALKYDLLRLWGVGMANSGAVVVNRTASATSLKLSEVREYLGCDVIGLVTPMAEACQAAQRNGLPVVLYQPDIIASQNVADMAGRLMQGQVVPLDVG